METDIPENAITAASILDAQNDIYKNFIIVDRRLTVRELKAKISAIVGIGLHELVFRRGGSHGVELLEDDDTLKQAQFYNHIGIFLKKGQPSVQGQKLINFFLARSSQTLALGDAANPEEVRIPDNCYFVFEELTSFPCDTGLFISQLKQEIVNKIGPLFPELGLEKLDLGQIRLREKVGDDKLTKVMHDQF